RRANLSLGDTAFSWQPCISRAALLRGGLQGASPAYGMLPAGEAAGNHQNKTAGSKPPRGGQGGVNDDLTPELRSSGCNGRCCCSCLARDCASCNQVATRIELSKESRRSVGSKPDARQIRQRDERRQVHHRA